MKILTAGRWLWTRTIGSTIFGEAVDSALFYPLAFYGSGHHPGRQAAAGDASQFITKVGVEVVFTPVTYKVVGGAEARRARGLLRPQHELLAVQPENLNQRGIFPAAVGLQHPAQAGARARSARRPSGSGPRSRRSTAPRSIRALPFNSQSSSRCLSIATSATSRFSGEKNCAKRA